MTLEQIQRHVQEYVISNPGYEAIFVRATTSKGGTEDVKAMLGANDPFTCAVMVMAVIESVIGLCEYRKNFPAEQRFILARGACAKIFELDTDYPSSTQIITKDYK